MRCSLRPLDIILKYLSHLNYNRSVGSILSSVISGSKCLFCIPSLGYIITAVKEDLLFLYKQSGIRTKWLLIFGNTYRFLAETFVIATFDICFYQTHTLLHFSQSTLIIALSTYLRPDEARLGIETSCRNSTRY